MRDSEYILDKLIDSIRIDLESVENKLLTGKINSMEDYKFNFGKRNVLYELQKTINELSRDI